jgi:DNA helicase HerA-like ATPase
MINILAADQLMNNPRALRGVAALAAQRTFRAPAGSRRSRKTKVRFLFDEAHLLFNDIPQALQEKIEQVVRLIRSKGVGVYFISQNPLDIPTRSSASSAIAFSTPCALYSRAIKRL